VNGQNQSTVTGEPRSDSGLGCRDDRQRAAAPQGRGESRLGVDDGAQNPVAGENA
jgi:hypothetical protein